MKHDWIRLLSGKLLPVASVARPCASRCSELCGSTNLFLRTILERGRKSEKLPKDLETFVQAEFLIASHHRDLFRQSLGDDLTVEGIRVQERQIEKRECMVRSVRQYAKVRVLKCAARLRCRKF